MGLTGIFFIPNILNMRFSNEAVGPSYSLFLGYRFGIRQAYSELTIRSGCCDIVHVIINFSTSIWDVVWTRSIPQHHRVCRNRSFKALQLLHGLAPRYRGVHLLVSPQGPDPWSIPPRLPEPKKTGIVKVRDNSTCFQVKHQSGYKVLVP
jgi:hypothetical protein